MKCRMILFFLVLTGLLWFTSCSDDDPDGVKTTEMALTVTDPENLEGVSLSDLKVEFSERNTGVKTTLEGFVDHTLTKSLPQGTYDIAVEGTISYTLDGKTQTAKVRASKEANVIIGDNLSLSLPLSLVLETSDFLIQEIFFSGTLTPEGKQYDGDKYIKIYNNTDSVLYADGLVIGESEFLTVTKQEYRPDIMSSDVAVGSLIQIPGSGKDYPVEPGQSILIVDNAINHLEYNSQSMDLTKANFEWYSESLGGETDNPSVPNMTNLYSRMVMHNRGFKSYVLARIPVSNEAYLTDYPYHYEYDFVFSGVIYPMDGDCYKIPNEWVLDAVNLSVEAEFQWIVTSPSLDMGWSHCGNKDKDPDRYGKSVRRKELSKTADGRVILKDTNNSTVDFTPDAKPSLMK